MVSFLNAPILHSLFLRWAWRELSSWTILRQLGKNKHKVYIIVFPQQFQFKGNVTETASDVKDDALKIRIWGRWQMQIRIKRTIKNKDEKKTRQHMSNTSLPSVYHRLFLGTVFRNLNNLLSMSDIKCIARRGDRRKKIQNLAENPFRRCVFFRSRKVI